MGKVYRETNRHAYVIMGVSLLDNPLISLKARGLYASIMRLPDDWELHLNAIEQLVPDGRDGIRTAFDELCKFGYAKRVRKLGTWDVNVSEYPRFLKEENTENVHNGKAVMYKTGKPSLLNNNVFNPQPPSVKKDRTPQTFLEALPISLTKDPTFVETWKEWVGYRKAMKHPLSLPGVKMMAKKLSRFSSATCVEAMQTSMENSWTGLFPKEPDPVSMKRLVQGNDGPRRVEVTLTNPKHQRHVDFIVERLRISIDDATRYVNAMGAFYQTLPGDGQHEFVSEFTQYDTKRLVGGVSGLIEKVVDAYLETPNTYRGHFLRTWLPPDGPQWKSFIEKEGIRLDVDILTGYSL